MTICHDLAQLKAGRENHEVICLFGDNGTRMRGETEQEVDVGDAHAK